MIIDGHAHISDSTYGNMDIYLAQLKEAGIERGVVVPGGSLDVRKMTEYISGRAKSENTVPNNPYVADACKAHPAVLTGLAMIDPHAENAAGKLENCFKEGFRGLKLSPLTHQFSFGGKVVAELAACCGEYGFPVYSHVVFSPGASTTKFINLSRQFPQTNFILGHMGFGPTDQDGLEAAVKQNNFFLETSTGSFLHIKQAVAKAGPEKIIFGSEFPLSHPKIELMKIMLLNLKDSDLDKILCDNMRNLTKNPIK